MKFKRNTLTAAILSAMIGVAGCSSSDDNPTASTSTANVSGIITGFGSVYVDGVEFETNGTSITIDGVQATEADLRVGMRVHIEGSDDGRNGNATSISFEDEVEGVVTQTVAGGGLQVMGLTITTDTTTHLDGLTDISSLAVGDEVEISGYPDGSGGVHATYIELEGSYNGSDEIEVKGTVANLTATTFDIGSMTVDFSGADMSEAGTLVGGEYVEVKAETAPDAVTGILTATKVELEDDGSYGVDGDEGEELEVEGMITAIDTVSTPNTITVNGQTFDVPAGIDISGFAEGDKIDLDIEIVGGVATIHEIEDESHDDDHPGKIEVEAVVDATDTVNNTITLGGVTISVDPAKVLMIDYSATPEHFFNLGSIVEGTDRVEVEAIPNPAGDGYIAISIEREAASSDTYVELEGPVSVSNDGLTDTYSVAGITVDLSGATFNDANTIANVSADVEISVKGAIDGTGVLVATEVEIKD